MWRSKIAVLFLCVLLMAIAFPNGAAPVFRTYPPNTITVSTGTGSGTIDDVFAVDGTTYDVQEANVGASTTHYTSEYWLVHGTLYSGSYPTCMQAADDTPCVFSEADDGGGSPTGTARLLTPIVDGTFHEFDLPVGTHAHLVDDDPPHDGDTTKIIAGAHGTTVYDTYEMENIGAAPIGQVPDTVEVYEWAKVTEDSFTGRNVIYLDSTIYEDPHSISTGLWTNYSYRWTSDPGTGGFWTVDRINNMECGVGSYAPIIAVGYHEVTAVGAVVAWRTASYVLDARFNATSVTSGRESYQVTARAKVDAMTPETITFYVYNHTTPGWDSMFSFSMTSYVTNTFDLNPTDHIDDADEIQFRVTDAGGDAIELDDLSIDLLSVRAYDLDYSMDFQFGWVGLESRHDPRLTIVGYKSDAETIALQVLRSGAWTMLASDVLQATTSSSESYDLAPADVIGSTLQIRFVDSDQTEEVQSTIYLNFVSLKLEIRDESPAAPITVYVEVGYDLWANEIKVRVSWVQSGGPEPAEEIGKWATIWVDDDTMLPSFQVNSTTRVDAPWSYFDGGDHNITAVGVVAVKWPTYGTNQTFYSDKEGCTVSNFPRWAVMVFGLFCVLSFVAVIAVAAVRERKEEEEGGGNPCDRIH